MRKLTQKEYFALLQTKRHFLVRAHQTELEGVIKAVTDTLAHRTVQDASCYTFKTVTRRTRDFVFTKEDGEKVYRGRAGKNSYYTHNQVLYHVNSQDAHLAIFVNV